MKFALMFHPPQLIAANGIADWSLDTAMRRHVAEVLHYTGGDQRLSVYVVPGWVRLDRPRQMTRGNTTVRLLRAGDATVGLVSERPEAVEAFERALTITVAEDRLKLAAGAPPGR